MVLASDIMNGNVWRSPSHRRAIIQWIDRDQFLLLGEPGGAMDGGTCMIAFSDGDGKVIFTAEQIALRLTREGWEREPRSVATISKR
jgi:hypothetical protein